MRLTPTPGLRTLIQPMFTSKPGWRCSKVSPRTAFPTKPEHLFRRMCIHKHTNLAPSVARLDHNGEHTRRIPHRPALRLAP